MVDRVPVQPPRDRTAPRGGMGEGKTREMVARAW